MSLKIGLDIDGVLSNFTQSIINKAKEVGYGCSFPCCWVHTHKWMMSPNFGKVWSIIETDHRFWLNIIPFDNIPSFKPEVYCTSRPISSAVTYKWLDRNKMPDAPIETVPVGFHGVGELKAKALKKHKIDIFIDDNGDNVTELNKLGVKTLLFDRPWNQEYQNLDEVRIHTFEDIKKYEQ